jgi:dUTP pyrophosphatase
MALLVYLAYPIDLDRGKAGFIDDYQMIKNRMIDEPGLTFYDPGRAFNANDCGPDQRVQAVNMAALTRADAVVAILPPDVPSVGTPMEIAWASAAGIPCHVLRDAPSWALQVDNIYHHSEMAYLLNAIQHLQPLPHHNSSAVAKFVPDTTLMETLPELDPQPRQGYPGDAGFDLIYYGAEGLVLHPEETINVPAGVKIEWPPNTWALVLGRSSSFHKRGLLVHPAVIDPGYRGEMFANVRNLSDEIRVIQPGERIAQVIPLPALAPKIRMLPTQRDTELSDSPRGAKGFGSSGT